MSSRFLTFPRLSVAVEAPDEVLDGLELFYPRSVVDASPPRVDFEYVLRRQDSVWSLYRDEVFISTYYDEELALLGLEFNLEGAILAKADDLVALHAGAAVVDGRACLIVGNADSGKTTTTFNLVELGHAFLCEEISLVEPETWRVQPFLQTPSLSAAVVREAERSFPVERGVLSPMGPSLYRYCPHDFCERPTPAGTILIPHYDLDASPGLTDVSPGEALTEVLGYCFEPNRDEEYLFDRMIAFLGNCQVVRMRYNSMSTARQILSDYFPAT